MEATNGTRDSLDAKISKIMWSEWLGGQRHPAHGFHSTELPPSVNQGKSDHSPLSLSLNQDTDRQKVPGQNIFWSSDKFFSELFVCVCVCRSGFNKSQYNSQTIKMLRTHKYVAYLLEFSMSSTIEMLESPS